jgi:hypothetical protein
MHTLTLSPVSYTVVELPLDFSGRRFFVHATRTVTSPDGTTGRLGFSVGMACVTRIEAERLASSLTVEG